MSWADKKIPLPSFLNSDSKSKSQVKFFKKFYAVFRIRDVLIRFRIPGPGSSGPLGGLRIRILLFSLVSFKIPTKSTLSF